MVWYDTADGLRAEFENAGKFEDLKEQLEETGIIYEDDFGGLVTSGFVEHAGSSLKELFLDPNSEYGYLGLAVDIPGESFRYFLFDANVLDVEEAKNKAILHFSK